jgi:hypothetical protein
MLLGRPWFKDAKVTHDWGNNVITIQGNGIVKTKSVNKKLGEETRRRQVLICYDLMEGIIDEEEDLIFETNIELLSIGIIIILDERVPLLNVGVTKIRINAESELEQGIPYQRTTKVVASTTKTIEFYVKPKTSLEDKVYPKTYYHHNQVDIEVDGTLAKIQKKNLQIASWTFIDAPPSSLLDLKRV